MKKGMKRTLEQAFQAPPSDRKALFLRRLPQAPLNMKKFVLTQMAFIRKEIWILSLLLFIGALYGEHVMRIQTLWAVSSFLPLAAMLTVCECMSSKFHGMEELETATRFSLKNIVLARLTIWGAADGRAFFLLLPLYRHFSLHRVYHRAEQENGCHLFCKQAG